MDMKSTNAGSLKPGSYVLLDGVPCVVKSVQTSKTGKHGHAKCRIEAIGMIENQKKILVMPGHDKVHVPMVEKKTAQILSINGEIASVMDSETFETLELNVPEDMKGQVSEGDQVLYWIIGQEKVLKQKK